MIVGTGIDLCEIARIERALGRAAGEAFRARTFTPGEIAYCEARKVGRFASYAARFAAKEAAMKALGTGWAEGIGWHDVEVVREGDGAPRLMLHGMAARLATRRRIRRWHLSLAHDGGHAIAMVIAEGGASARGARSGRARGRSAA